MRLGDGGCLVALRQPWNSKDGPGLMGLRGVVRILKQGRSWSSVQRRRQCHGEGPRPWPGEPAKPCTGISPLCSFGDMMSFSSNCRAVGREKMC